MQRDLKPKCVTRLQRGGTGVAGDGFVQPAQLLQRVAAVVPCLGQCRPQREGMVIGGQRLRRAVHLQQRVAAPRMGFRQARPRRDRFLEARQRLRLAAQVMQRGAQVVQRFGIIGRLRDGAREAFRRLLVPTEFHQHDAMVEVDARQRRVERPCLGEAGGGLVQLPGRAQRIAQVVARLRRLRVQRHRPLQRLHGECQLSRLQGRQAEEMRRLEMPGIARQHGAVDRLGFGDPPLHVDLPGAGHLLIERRVRHHPRRPLWLRGAG